MFCSILVILGEKLYLSSLKWGWGPLSLVDSDNIFDNFLQQTWKAEG